MSFTLRSRGFAISDFRFSSRWCIRQSSGSYKKTLFNKVMDSEKGAQSAMTRLKNLRIEGGELSRCYFFSAKLWLSMMTDKSISVLIEFVRCVGFGCLAEKSYFCK